MNTWKKDTFGRQAEWEVAGLEWLRQAEQQGGARIVRVEKLDASGLYLEKLESGSAGRQQAQEFGAALAHTHAAGAPAYGVGPTQPTQWEGNGYFGPNEDLQTLILDAYDHWGTMYAEARLAPVYQAAAHTLGPDNVYKLEKLSEKLRDGNFDDATTPARLHGDLWAGNVLWTPEGVVLIDPSAHAGHPLTDLAALSLFGCSELEAIYDAYEQETEAELPSNWRQLLPLHQLSMLLMHVQVFGSSYVRRTMQAVSQYL